MQHLWFLYPIGIASFLSLPIATYIAGRWTGQRWLFALTLLVMAVQLIMAFFVRRIVERAANAGCCTGTLTIGELVSVLETVGNFANRLLLAAIILVTARAAVRNRN